MVDIISSPEQIKYIVMKLGQTCAKLMSKTDRKQIYAN